MPFLCFCLTVPSKVHCKTSGYPESWRKFITNINSQTLHLVHDIYYIWLPAIQVLILVYPNEFTEPKVSSCQPPPARVFGENLSILTKGNCKLDPLYYIGRFHTHFYAKVFF